MYCINTCSKYSNSVMRQLFNFPRLWGSDVHLGNDRESILKNRSQKWIYFRWVLLTIFLLISVFSGCSGKKSTLLSESELLKANDTNSTTLDTINTQSDSVMLIDSSLSTASQLMLRACDNYLSINDSGQKSAEVMNIKASLLYNNRLYDRSRSVYLDILQKFPETHFSYESMQMIAQSYYEEKRFNEAQEWYRKLSYVAQSAPDKQDALRRIAESIFRMAESYENISKFKDAAIEYERISIEFPESHIADISLFNAGLSYEKLTNWTHAILIFERLIQKYPNSQLLPKAQFRIAKNHEKLQQWDYAAEAYLKVAFQYTKSELGPLALYNAGFSFENAGKLKEAAAAFEKLSIIYPQAPDAPDVLFKAGEIYGKIKDWESVTRVNRVFMEKFGADEDRIIQALCMTGIALYMQGKDSEAIRHLEKTALIFSKLKNISSVNVFYAAKAIYTLGEIYHDNMNKISLSASRSIYKKQLEQKSALLNNALESYSKVIKFSISEWTTRAIFQIGQIYEDFGVGIFRQQRPEFNSFDDRMALELGIAQAVEEYFIEKSVYYHELNVKLGIKEQIKDKFVEQSQQKLTYLPYMAGENYLTLVTINKNASGAANLDGFSSIAKTLQTLQKVAPFQEKAIALYLKCLELGSTYNEKNEFYDKAASNITEHSFMVGQTYDKVVSIAREAPIPENFSRYERFVYKTKLLKQVETYEDQALTNYLKTLKIADAYKINTPSVKQSQQYIARLLFNKARCYDLLAQSAIYEPPFPDGINDAEQQEFIERFKEIADKFNSQAVEIYKTVLEFSGQNYAFGEFVTHSYMRLYQMLPNTFGVPEVVHVKKIVSPDTLWTTSTDSVAKWVDPHFNDSAWSKADLNADSSINELPLKGSVSLSYNFPNASNTNYAFFRRSFNIVNPCSSALFISQNPNISLFINEHPIKFDVDNSKNGNLFEFNVSDWITSGQNIIAIKLKKTNSEKVNLHLALYIWEEMERMVPKPPGSDTVWTIDSGKQGVYIFPYLKNFSKEKDEARK